MPNRISATSTRQYDGGEQFGGAELVGVVRDRVAEPACAAPDSGGELTDDRADCRRAGRDLQSGHDLGQRMWHPQREQLHPRRRAGHAVELNKVAIGGLEALQRVRRDGEHRQHRRNECVRCDAGTEPHHQDRCDRDDRIRFVNATRPDSDIGTADEILERFRPTVEYFDGLDRRIALGAAVMGGVQWAGSPDAAHHEVTLMREFGIINQAHFLETAEALDHQLAKFAWYDDAGALGPDFIFGHFVQATDAVIERTAQAGARMSWQATANGRLGSGVAPIPEILRAGIDVGLGLDDQACSDLADPWQNMRIAAYSVRAERHDPRALEIRRVLEMQTLGAARIIGVDDRVGSLTVGKFGDFVLVDPTAPDIGPLWNPVDAYVLACSLRNLRGVYVGGVQVSDGMQCCDPLARKASAEIRARQHVFNPARS